MTSSTTLRVLEKGALKTATPWALALGQVYLVRPDAKGAHSQQVRGGFERRVAGTWVLLLIPSTSTSGKRASSSSSGKARSRRLHLVARLGQDGCGVRVDVLQEQDANVLGGWRWRVIRTAYDGPHRPRGN